MPDQVLERHPRMYRVLFATLPFAMVAIAVFFAGATYTINRNSQKLDDQVQQNRQTLNFICSTTHVLDLLVVQVRDQIDANFDNGTYKRLLDQGVITPDDVAQAHKSRNSYQDSHLQLTGPQADSCEGR